MPFDGEYHNVAVLKGLLAKASKVKANISPAAYQFGTVNTNASLAANDSIYARSAQKPPFPDHSSANKSAKSKHFTLFLNILSKRYFWHATAAIAASLLGFGVFLAADSKGQNIHPLTASW